MEWTGVFVTASRGLIDDRQPREENNKKVRLPFFYPQKHFHAMLDVNSLHESSRFSARFRESVDCALLSSFFAMIQTVAYLYSTNCSPQDSQQFFCYEINFT